MKDDRICFIDMDGVLCDFCGGLAKAFDRPNLLGEWPRGEYRCEVVLGILVDEFWQRIEATPGFWEELEPFPWVDDLLIAVAKAGFRPVISTAPSRDPSCSAGKVRWMQKHLHPRWRDFFLGHEKALLAKPGRLLIDDNEMNCEQFVGAGGEAILFPQIWNLAHRCAGDPMGLVCEVLNNLAPPADFHEINAPNDTQPTTH